MTAVLALISTEVMAEPSLRGMMREWKADLRDLRAAVRSGGPDAAATARPILRRLAGAAAGLEARITANTASARQFRTHLQAFRADADAATGAADAVALRGGIDRLGRDCQSCHDVFKN